jgi:hypothetical protein
MIDFLLRGHFVISSIYDSYPFVILSQLLTQEEITDLIEKNSKNIMDNFKKEIQKSDDFRVVVNVLSNQITKVIRTALETELKKMMIYTKKYNKFVTVSFTDWGLIYIVYKTKNKTRRVSGRTMKIFKKENIQAEMYQLSIDLLDSINASDDEVLYTE